MESIFSNYHQARKISKYENQYLSSRRISRREGRDTYQASSKARREKKLKNIYSLGGNGSEGGGRYHNINRRRMMAAMGKRKFSSPAEGRLSSRQKK